MSSNRVKKHGLTNKNPPSPPLSEKNGADTDDRPERHANAAVPPKPQTVVPTSVSDEDEDIPEDIDPAEYRTQSQRAVYAPGGYNTLKSYKGQVYSGMSVGGSHTWTYEPGTWKETKEEPDLWRINYRTNKRRAKNAPQGSGAPVGTEYHWFIVAHQYVKKIDANTYETDLSGYKYKLAYKSVGSNSWSVPTVKKQREREVELLEDAKQRVQGLPPVLASERVKVEKHEKGQQKLDSMFRQSAKPGSKKRKIGDSGEE
ncbi:hypothetical protein EYZ11_003306 [Aspergillus tanneri]|uniref:Uncharacterized protein n=1 Tax=Aspergillus tanneri TaxID=1220188 RepID=A0A4S3JQQ4_9EURO|nr:uncharacterized protein ATNIH1004_001746 [Aspergillus tanneri]KAA8652837.1 hypothetical protein ATNIH1004_001746 [Aspergillus tanneri]THC97197.1 hypothetical protein EYZ11_003306 [Aspergillus tanneri]